MDELPKSSGQTRSARAVVSATAVLGGEGPVRLMELSGVASVAVDRRERTTMLRLDNLTDAELLVRSPVDRGEAVIESGQEGYMDIDPRQPACFQLVAAGLVAITLTVTLLAPPEQDTVVAQAVVAR
jgi:hypothetical protein